MTDKNKKADKPEGRLSEDQRFKYVGFDVYPGKIKDFFKSDAEKDNYVQALSDKRSKGELLRDHCTLTEERVSFGERLVLTVVSLIIIGALFLPWYSAYTEVSEESSPVETVSQEAMMDSTGTMLQEGALSDSVIAAGTDATNETVGEEIAATEEAIDSAASEVAQADAEPGVPEEESEMEIITGVQAQVKVHREYERLSGIGGLISLGSVGGYIFSSGLVLILTVIIFILYTLAAVGLPLYTLYMAWGVKATGDEHALKLKKVLRLYWWPVLALVVAIAISFVGANYGFSLDNMFTSIGTSYGIAVMIDSLSWGVFVTMAGFVLMAAKGMEI